MQKHLIAVLPAAMLLTLLTPPGAEAQTVIDTPHAAAKVSSKAAALQTKPLTDDKYDNATDFSEGLAAVKVNNKWGFIDTTGKMVIAPQFNPWQQQFNAHFSEGLVAINASTGKIANKESNDPNGVRWGFADKTGKIVIPPKFEANYYSPPHFSEGLAVISGRFIGTTIATFGLHAKFGYIDKTGKFVIPQNYDDAMDFYEGMASVKVGEKYGFIDKTGKMVIQPIYDSPSYFKDGVAIVELNHLNYVVDKQNKRVLTKGLAEMSQFFEGLARFEENDRVGYVDIKGNVKIKPTFEFGSEQSARQMYFSEGMCQFEDGGHAMKDKYGNFRGKFGYINKDGKIIIPAQYDYAGPFKNGIAIVSMGGNYGYIDKAGNFLIQPIYANAGYFIDGIARVSGGGSFADYKYRFIKRN